MAQSKDKGYIKIPRSVFSSDVWKERRMFSRFEALADIYQSADYKSRKMNVSFRMLADRWGWCVGKVQRFMATLSRYGFISVTSDGKSTTITVTDTPTDTPNDTVKDLFTEGFQDATDTPTDTPNDTHTDTPRAYKNDNNISCLNNDSSLCSESTKEEENDSSLRSESKKKNSIFKKPSVSEVAAYCKKMDYPIDPEAFWYFYESKGWMVGKNKMTDWKAACRTWVRKRKEEARKADDTRLKNNSVDKFDNSFKSWSK